MQYRVYVAQMQSNHMNWRKKSRLICHFEALSILVIIVLISADEREHHVVPYTLQQTRKHLLAIGKRLALIYFGYSRWICCKTTQHISIYIIHKLRVWVQVQILQVAVSASAGTVRYNTIQYCAVQYYAVQFNVVQYSVGFSAVSHTLRCCRILYIFVLRILYVSCTYGIRL